MVARQRILRENLWPSSPPPVSIVPAPRLGRRLQRSLPLPAPVLATPAPILVLEAPAPLIVPPAPPALPARDPQELLGLEEVAAALKISKTAVLRFCRQGDLPAVRAPGGFEVEWRHVRAWLVEVGEGVRR